MQPKEDLEYALKAGQLNSMFRAMALRRLVLIRRIEIVLGIAKEPNKMRDEGVAVLESIVKDHPSPHSVYKAMHDMATANRPGKEISDQLFRWLDKREELLKWQCERMEKFKAGEILVLESHLRSINEGQYKTLRAKCYSQRAYLNDAIGQVSKAYENLENGMILCFTYTEAAHFLKEAKGRGSLQELLILKRIIEKWTDGRLKSRDNDDHEGACALLSDVNNMIHEFQIKPK